MKIKDLISALKHIEEFQGSDIEVDLQISPEDSVEFVTSYPDFFIAEDTYENEMRVGLRTWPY